MREAAEEQATNLEISLEKTNFKCRELRREVTRLNSVLSNVSLYSRALVRNRNIIVWKVSSKDAQVKFVSKPGCQNILKYDPQQLISHSFLDTVYKDDVSRARKILHEKTVLPSWRFDEFGRVVWLDVQSYPNKSSETSNTSSTTYHEDVVVGRVCQRILVLCILKLGALFIGFNFVSLLELILKHGMEEGITNNKFFTQETLHLRTIVSQLFYSLLSVLQLIDLFV